MTTTSQIAPSQRISGYILTRQAFDTKQGIKLSFWLKTEQGAVNVLVNHELAVFFVEHDKQELCENLLVKQKIAINKVSPLRLKTFNQVPVVGFYFSTMREYYRAKELLKTEQIKCYEDDFRPDDRYLMERFITASAEFSLSDYNTYSKKKSHDFPCYTADKARTLSDSQALHKQMLDMVSLDIECSMQGELYSIGLYSHNLKDHCIKHILMIGDQNNISHTSKLTEQEQNQLVGNISWLPDEQALLKALIDWIHIHDPDVIIGWNVIQFDFNLLQKRCDLHQIDFSIGRDNKVPRWRSNKNTEQKYIDIAGRVILDGIDLLKTATYNFPSYSLDNVANKLLGIGKKVDDVENRVKEITDNFHHDKLALAAYNLEDCRLVTLIFEHTQLLEFAMLRSQLTGLSIDRVGGSVAAFTNLYLPKLHRAGYVAPNMGDGLKGLVSPGGFVMDSIPGLYKNVLVLDFKSLYPSIIRSFNIDPMGMIEGLKAPELAIEGFDGAYFSRKDHFLPDIINELWQERDKAKKDNNAALSQAIKIIMNSFYGVLGSTGCRFFDPRLSGSITKRSHELLKTTKLWIENKGYKVIYGDTDSIFVHIGDEQTKAQSLALGKTLETYINEEWQQTLKEKFKIDSKLEIEFETHFSQFFMPSIRGQEFINGNKSIGTKKRYAGLTDKGMVFKGLETVRSDWTELSKKFQQALYQLIFDGQPIEEFILKTVDVLRSGVNDDELIYTKKIRRKLSDYKNTPPHIKAALIANHKLKEQGKKEKYKHRSTIRYIMTLDGIQPLEMNTSKLDYDFYIEKQLKPIADDILPFIGKSFEEICGQQLGLF